MRLTLTGNKNIKNLFTIRKQLMIWLETEIYVTYFLKTNLTKFAFIWVKRCQKAGFLTPRSSKITETKEKERRKRNNEEKERRRREKSNGCARSFYNSYSGDGFWRRKLNCWAQKVHSVHNKQILKDGSYKLFDNLGAATWKDPSAIAEP